MRTIAKSPFIIFVAALSTLCGSSAYAQSAAVTQPEPAGGSIAPLVSSSVATTPTALSTPPQTPAPPQTPVPPPTSPAVLPGNGIMQYDFLYVGEWDTRNAMQTLKLVKHGKIVETYSIPIKMPDGRIEEFDDATMLSNGDIVFSRMRGAGKISPDGKLIWNYDAPVGTEVHSVVPVGDSHAWIMQNGNPAMALYINTVTNTIEKQIVIPTKTIHTHGQFRHLRLTKAGTLLVGHMDMGKVSEYDMTGKEIWSVPAKGPWAAVRLKNGDTLISGDAYKYAREVNPAGQTVWELTQADIPDYTLGNIQECDRLDNGDTVICNWIAGYKDKSDWPNTAQVIEVNPQKKVVWALRSWSNPDLGPASSIQILNQPGKAEDGNLQR